MYTKNFLAFQKAYVHKNFHAFQKAYVHKNFIFKKLWMIFKKLWTIFKKQSKKLIVVKWSPTYKKSSKSICTQKIFRKFMFFHAFQKACSRK